jgi:two-component system, cell cycle response regulator DivK
VSKILLVEDNELNRDMLSRRLMRRGYEIHVAVNGNEGFKMAKSLKPDLILMDLSLPEMDGWEVISHLKNDPSTRGIPTIALTAYALATDRERAIMAGFDDFDSKPVELQRLLAKMNTLLGQEETQ